jgi:hypothetical protein
MFQGSLLPLSSGSVYQTTQHIPEDGQSHTHHCENPRPHCVSHHLTHFWALSINPDFTPTTSLKFISFSSLGKKPVLLDSWEKLISNPGAEQKMKKQNQFPKHCRSAKLGQWTKPQSSFINNQYSYLSICNKWTLRTFLVVEVQRKHLFGRCIYDGKSERKVP